MGRECHEVRVTFFLSYTVPQHLLPRLTPVAHQPLAPDILEETSPWEYMYPLQAVETPAK